MGLRVVVGLCALGVLLETAGSTACAGEHFISLASTTSIEQSGLFLYLLPKYFNERAFISV